MAAENSIITNISTPKSKTTLDNNEPAAHKSIQQHPRHGSATNIFKVALFMMRGSSRKSRVLPVDEESKSVWRKLVGSMRPLHLQSNNSPPPQRNNNNSNRKLKKMVTMPCKSVASYSLNEDGFEYAASDFTNSPSPLHRRYASAIGLSEMVQEDEENLKEKENVIVEIEEEEEESDGDGEGNDDEMIDAKAEEFIAQFYQQMRLQRLDVVDRRYNEISQRSLGL